MIRLLSPPGVVTGVVVVLSVASGFAFGAALAGSALAASAIVRLAQR